MYEYYNNGDFQQQVANNTNFTTLGVNLAEWQPINTIGLKAPPSLVNQNVIDARSNLTEIFDMNEYYHTHSRPLLDNTTFLQIYGAQYGPIGLSPSFNTKMFNLNK